MFVFLFLALFVIASFAFGSFLLNRAGIRFYSFAEEFSFSTATGYGAIILVTYALGFSGLLYMRFYLFLFLAAILLGFGRVRYFFSRLPKLFNEVFLLLKSAVKLEVFSILLLLIIFFLAFNFVASLAPPWSYDATVYHLAVPKIYAAHHGFISLPSLLHSNLVMSSHTLFLAAMVLSGGRLASLVNFSFAALLAAGIFSFCTRFFDRKTAILASAFFITLPIVNVFSASANNDLPLALFAFLAFYAFVVWASERKLWWLALSAFLSGLASSTKMTGLVILPIMAGLFLFHFIFVKKPLQMRQMIIATALFSSVAVAVALPAFIKNLVYAGNPFYPLFSGVFGGNYLSKQMVDSFVGAVKTYGTGVGLKSAVFLPWNLTMYPLKFVEQLGITPLFLAFIPLLVFVRKNTAIKFTLAIGLLYLGVWFFTAQALRYAIYIFPFFSVVSAFVIVALASKLGRKQYFFMSAIVAAVFIFSAALLFGANLKQIPVALGFESEDQFFAKLHDGNIYGICKFANDNLPRDAKLLLLYDNRGYHCNGEYFVSVPVEQAYIDYSAISTPEQLAARLKELGVTNVIINRNSPIYKPGGKAFSREVSALLDSFLSKYGNLAHSAGSADLYSINYS